MDFDEFAKFIEAARAAFNYRSRVENWESWTVWSRSTILNLYPPPQLVDPRSPRRMISQGILAPLGSGLCKILHLDFREHLF